jgi:hypothetical protein
MPRPGLHVLSGPPDERLGLERLMSYIQDQTSADFPDMSAEVSNSQFHTGRLPNGAKSRNRPKLMLMGQRRYANQHDTKRRGYEPREQKRKIVNLWSGLPENATI